MPSYYHFTEIYPVIEWFDVAYDATRMNVPACKTAHYMSPRTMAACHA